MTQEEFLLHYGIKGMKWGVRRASNKLSRKDKKLIRIRKNQLLNAVVAAELKIDKAVSPKLRVSYDEAMSGGAKQKAYLAQKARLSNEFVKNNPNVLPKGMSIKYDPSKFAGDDLQLEPSYSYNGKRVDFQAFAKAPDGDRFLLDPPKRSRNV